MSASASLPEAGRDGVSRLMITRMVLENFKSYAGEQVIGPFHKRFSSVVGPNGSGKSNVIDALLFVFGKRAKQLRLNKVSELIHKSSRFPSLEYARVSVHFQMIIDHEESEDDFTVVPGSEFVVTRIAYANNQSKYTVEGKTSTYTEVGQLLRNYGVDLDNNRFLILQGEVEQIAMMKPKSQAPHEEGLLEYLEDIIGSNKFVEAIEAASKIVDENNEQRVEKINRLKIAEKDKDNLEGPMKDAQFFLEKESEIRVHQNILYQYYIHEAGKNVEDAKGQAEALKEKLSYERTKLKDTETKLSEIEKVYASTNAEYDRLTEEMQRTAEEFTAYERKDTKMIEDMKHIQQQVAKTKNAITKDAKKEQDCLSEVQSSAQQVTSLKADIESNKALKATEEAALDEIMQGLSAATASLRSELEGVQGRLADAERKVSTLQTEKETVQTALQLQQSRASSAAKNLASLNEKLQKLSSDESDFSSRRIAVQKEIRNCTEIVNQTTNEVAQLKQLESDLQNQMKAAVAAAEEGKAALQQGSGGRSDLVTAVMNATKRGGRLAGAGVRGRLGDLGSINADYDLAISMACGMLDAIVVDTAEGAQQCVAFLREHNLGRATFIVLRELGDQRARMDATPAGMPAAAKRLFDLITPVDAMFRPAFYLALKDTLVMSDLDSAVKVAYVGDKVKWRVVTLDGNLIDTSGTMSGGGKPVRTGGGMGSRPRAADADAMTPAKVQQLEAAVSALQGTMQECRVALGDSEKRMEDAKQKMKAAEIEIEKIDMAVGLIREQIQDIHPRIAALSAELEFTPAERAEIANLETRIQDLNRRIAAASPDLASLQVQAQNLQSQILEVGGPKLKRAQAKVDAIASALDTLMQSLSTAEVGESNAKKQAAKAAQARVKSEKELEKLMERQVQLEAEQKQLESEAEKVVLAQQQAKAAAESQEAVLKNITKEHNQLKELVNTVRSVELDLTTSFDEFTKVYKENELKKSHWSEKLKQIRAVHSQETREQNQIARSLKRRPETSTPSTDGSMEIVQESVALDVPVTDGVEWSEKEENLPEIAPEDLPAGRKVEELKREINLLEGERDKQKGNVNLSAIEQFKEKMTEYRSKLHELEEVTVRRDTARKAFDDLRKQRLDMFMQGFGVITLKLKEMYQMITLGGDAELELVDSLDPFSEGIVFSVRPPKKSWKNISNLSGGEKTLSSLALVFALHHFKPTPLYVMDEIDAALDFKNVSIVANYIKERTKNAQFVIISLRNNMFELADRLVGIYKTNDATKSVTINPKLFDAAVHGHRAAENPTPAATTTSSSSALVAGKNSTDIRPVLVDTTNTRI